MKKYKILLAVMLPLFSACNKEPLVEHQSADLGLSVKWAKVNVGADNVMETGNRYAWGEIQVKDSYTDDNYEWFDEDGKITKYCSDPTYGTPDYIQEVEPADDAATKLWGKGWRMPTVEEMQELIEKCTWTLTSVDGVKGYKVTSNVPGHHGQYIFLPAEDAQEQYWTSSNCAEGDNRQSECLVFNVSKLSAVGNSDVARSAGALIRPVHK